MLALGIGPTQKVADAPGAPRSLIPANRQKCALLNIQGGNVPAEFGLRNLWPLRHAAGPLFAVFEMGFS